MEPTTSETGSNAKMPGVLRDEARQSGDANKEGGDTTAGTEEDITTTDAAGVPALRSEQDDTVNVTLPELKGDWEVQNDDGASCNSTNNAATTAAVGGSLAGASAVFSAACHQGVFADDHSLAAFTTDDRDLDSLPRGGQSVVGVLPQRGWPSRLGPTRVSVEEWSADHVSWFLETEGFPEVAAAAERQRVNGATLLYMNNEAWQALGVSNPIERAKLRGATLRAQRVYAGTLVWQWQRPLLLGALVCVVCSAILIAVAVRVGSIV